MKNSQKKESIEMMIDGHSMVWCVPGPMESWETCTRNSVWSPVWYHAGMVRGHAATQVIS